MEILELLNNQEEDPLYTEIKTFLDKKKSESETLRKLIDDGYSMLEK
jgi:hypothetical protein